MTFSLFQFLQFFVSGQPKWQKQKPPRRCRCEVKIGMRDRYDRCVRPTQGWCVYVKRESQQYHNLHFTAQANGRVGHVMFSLSWRKCDLITMRCRFMHSFRSRWVAHEPIRRLVNHMPTDTHICERARAREVLRARNHNNNNDTDNNRQKREKHMSKNGTFYNGHCKQLIFAQRNLFILYLWAAMIL